MAMELAKKILTTLLAGQIFAAAICLGACCALNSRQTDASVSSQPAKAAVSSGHCHAAKKEAASKTRKASSSTALQPEIALPGGLHDLCICLVEGESPEKPAMAAPISNPRDVSIAIPPADCPPLWLLDPSPPPPDRISSVNVSKTPHPGHQLSLRI